MTASAGGRPGRGLAFATASYGLFSLQDATVKWLVQDYAILQVLFMRSLVVAALAVAAGGRPALRALRASRHKGALAIRAVLILLAWGLFFTASRHLGLAALTTIYFAAPAITVLLSVLVLREVVAPGRWLAVAVGFAGVLVAAHPGSGIPLGPALLTLGAATVWACGSVMARVISRQESTVVQMITSNLLFILACGGPMFGLWRTPDFAGLGLMLAIGVAGGLGQVLMYEGFRWAPASLVAPTEYTAFIWAFLLGFAIWGDVPTPSTWIGAGLILCAGILLVWTERHTLGRREVASQEALL